MQKYAKGRLNIFLASLFIIFGRDDDIYFRDCFTVPVTVPDRAPDTNNETII